MGHRKRKPKATDNLAAREDLAKHFDDLADESTESMRGALTDAIAEIDEQSKMGGDEESIALHLVDVLLYLGERRGYRCAAADIRESAEKA